MHFIQWHHIFPKSLLKARGFETGEINEIANMAFITGQTNRRLSNRPPHEYLYEIIASQSVDALRAQQVPDEEALWHLARYRDFLTCRRTALAERMNAFIDRKAGITTVV